MKKLKMATASVANAEPRKAFTLIAAASCEVAVEVVEQSRTGVVGEEDEEEAGSSVGGREQRWF